MLNPLIARFAGEPALIDPQQAERFKASLDALMAHPRASELLNERASDDYWPDEEDWMADFRPYVVKDGILQIPVKGVLLHDFDYQFGSWATGYEYIWRAFKRGCGDYMTGAIRGIAFQIDSGGGMVAGCFDAVDKMYALKQECGVPVRAFAHEGAYSAAYAIFSLGDQGVVSRTGGVGSIGVVTSHLDMSQAMEMNGYKVTFIHAGKHKVDGNPYEALPDDVITRIQARIDELYGVFVSTVARNRPQLSEEAIRATEALTFTATQALSNGLADSIGSLDDALVAFAADLSSDEGDERMSTKDTAADTQAAITAAVADANAQAAQAQAAAVAEARTSERARIAAILGSEEASGRTELAHHIAMKTDMSVEDARGMLSAAPLASTAPAAPAAAASPFEAAMSTGNPNVGANHRPAEPASAEDGSADLELAALVGLRGFAR